MDGEVGVFCLCIVERPLDEVVGQIEPSVIVRAILEINQNEGRLVRVLPQQNIALLHIVVTEHHRRLQFHQVLPAEKTKKNASVKNFCYNKKVQQNVSLKT